MNAEENGSSLPEPLRALLRELRAKSAARVRAAMEQARREWLSR